MSEKANSVAKDQNLPQLLYTGDVPVESSYHGSALLYRLLQDYPKDKLLILQPAGITNSGHRKLVRVTYADIKLHRHRFLQSRFARAYRSWLVMTAKARSSLIGKACAEFTPEAVITVAHEVSWISAASFAREKKLPLYVIVHDHWPTTFNVWPIFRRRLDDVFGAILRQAKAVFCVSPEMRDTYVQRYGAPAHLLYPSQPHRTTSLKASSGFRSERGSLIVAFAGTINSDGYATLLRSVADALTSCAGKLLLFGPHTASYLKSWGLDSVAVENCGLVDSNEIGDRLAREADVLLVPMSFQDYDSENMRLGFPSKIAEYCATGIPMLIFGPEYCSAVQWARQYDSVAEVVVNEAPVGMRDALSRLQSPAHRSLLGSRAREVGEQLFSHTNVQAAFYSVLSGDV